MILGKGATTPARAGLLAWLGGGATLVSGLAFLGLQAAIFATLYVSLGAQGDEARAALKQSRASRDARELLQGVNEVVLTGGSSASRAVAVEALARLDTALAADDGAVDPPWSRSHAAVVAFLNRPDPSPSDVETLIALGKLTVQLGKWAGVAETRAQDAEAHYERSRRRAHILLLGAGGLGFAGIGGIFYMFYRGVTRPLRGAVDYAERLACGDLSHSVSTVGGGEATQLLHALRTAQQNLGGLVSDVRGGTLAVAAASQSIAEGGAELSTRSEQQAASLEESASAMAQLAQAVDLNAGSAQRANGLAREAALVATRGGELMGSVIETMGRLSDTSRRVAAITEVLDRVAFQTNILALNAAVEAARAGEHGRGFAVVAAEVRQLANHSAASSREIKKLVETAVSGIDDGLERVRAAGATMEEIVVAAGDVRDAMGQMAAASQQQAASIGQVTRAVSQMEGLTQRNAEMAAQTAAAVSQLSGIAQNLVESVGRFRLPDEIVEDPEDAPLTRGLFLAMDPAERTTSIVDGAGPGPLVKA